jgi:hypothetical protein
LIRDGQVDLSGRRHDDEGFDWNPGTRVSNTNKTMLRMYAMTQVPGPTEPFHLAEAGKQVGM